MNLLGFGTNSTGYSGVIGCVELCDKDDENNALHHRDCVGAVFSSLNIDVNDLSSSNQINIAFLSLFLQLLETGIRPSGYCGVFPCCVRNTTESVFCSDMDQATVHSDIVLSLAGGPGRH